MGFQVSSHLVVKISLKYQGSISSDTLLCGTAVTPAPLIYGLKATKRFNNRNH